MELSFSYYTWIVMLKNKPYMLPFLIGFGMLFMTALIAGLLGPLVPARFKKASTVIGILPLIITWLMGFFITLPMVLTNINVIHILLSIFIIYLSALMFCILNLNILVIFLDSFADAKFMTKTMTYVYKRSQTQQQNSVSSKSRRKRKAN